VVQGIGPEFKPQHCNKTKQTKKKDKYDMFSLLWERRTVWWGISGKR
jgi:hypothetical protein